MGPGQPYELGIDLGNRFYFSFFLTAQFEKCLFQLKDCFASGEEDNCLEVILFPRKTEAEIP